MIGVLTRKPSFSAIARSVMISAEINRLRTHSTFSFSAIARSVMISAVNADVGGSIDKWFQCYSS